MKIFLRKPDLSCGWMDRVMTVGHPPYDGVLINKMSHDVIFKRQYKLKPAKFLGEENEHIYLSFLHNPPQKFQIFPPLINLQIHLL